jgi:hypothetical protein
MRDWGCKAGSCCGGSDGSGDSRGEPGRSLGGAMGKSRGPVKTVRSGIFVQSAHFS